MKKILILMTFIFYYLVNSNASNPFDCIPESRNIFSDYLLDEVKYCYNDYISLRKTNLVHRIIEVDISTTNDTINIWLVDNYVSSLNVRHPDGYIQFSDNLAFLYTSNYSIVKDTVWLEKLYQISKRYTMRTTYSMVSWEKNTYKRINFINNYLKEQTNSYNPCRDLYEPISYKYVFVNKHLIKKTVEWQSIHPNLYIPKNIDEPWTW